VIYVFTTLFLSRSKHRLSILAFSLSSSRACDDSDDSSNGRSHSTMLMPTRQLAIEMPSRHLEQRVISFTQRERETHERAETRSRATTPSINCQKAVTVSGNPRIRRHTFPVKQLGVLAGLLRERAGSWVPVKHGWLPHFPFKIERGVQRSTVRSRVQSGREHGVNRVVPFCVSLSYQA
jgi:hypothetical protein